MVYRTTKLQRTFRLEHKQNIGKDVLFKEKYFWTDRFHKSHKGIREVEGTIIGVSPEGQVMIRTKDGELVQNNNYKLLSKVKARRPKRSRVKPLMNLSEYGYK